MASQFVARPRFLRSYKEIPLFDGCFEQIEKQNLNLETFVIIKRCKLILKRLYAHIDLLTM